MPGTSTWIESVKTARANLALTGLVPVGGKTENGQKLLKEAKAIHATKVTAVPLLVVPRKKPDRVCMWRPGRPREKLVDVRYYVDNGKARVPVSENPSWYPGVSFKNGNGMKQVRANKEPRDLDSWCVCWASRDEDGKPVRNARHFYVGQFYTKDDQDYDNAKRRARQFAIEFRKQKVREFDELTKEKDRLNFERLKALDKLHQYRPPRNRVAARQSGRQGVTWMKTTQSWQVQMRVWDAALRKSRVMKQCHVRIAFAPDTTQADEEQIENAVEQARKIAVNIRKEWENRYRCYTVKHYAKYPKYDETGRLIEDEPEEEEGGPRVDQYGNPIGENEEEDDVDMVGAADQDGLEEYEDNEDEDEIVDEGELLPEELDGLVDDNDMDIDALS
mmetsp:Transcript_18583/g.46368  ORF Transcript_18583/g.46368 Transcript_18583/m.46368 type:complete len:390 (-) Transcript_18583:699-1868(-)|eukprot:CAMPEP_0178992994 /NCGR_PEP_ID=MMETSP0795-20121207/6437_1 /TAXON_ID=88552 /ORGANISM="Amoebophrya sp., Strain Ameob2" /LENGTH=389 /DNA_ID=CAMNT_0020684965 /DNA_START=81 /DNA_END=1250 /DNA_ORIENTATION=-